MICEFLGLQRFCISPHSGQVLLLGDVSFSEVVDVGHRLVKGGSLLLQSMSLKLLARW